MLIPPLRFAASLPILSKSCAQYPGSPANNLDSENNDLKTAIKTVAGESGVDARYIFAVVMQESNGCVRAPTTNYGVTNPGLMQSHNGPGSCNRDGNVQNPCPLSEITTMIRDGTQGTPDGDGLKQLLGKTGTNTDSKYYIAARMYNSGSVAASKNLGDGIATHCYATDIANRLIGWSTGATGCKDGDIGTLPVLNVLFKGPATSPTPAAVENVETPEVPPVTTRPTAPNPAAGVFIEKQADPKPTNSVVEAVVPVDIPHTETTVAAVSPPEPNLPIVTPVTTGGGSGHAMAAGTPCATEGQWNCINTSSFQQCASGVWSVVQNLAEGTVCKSGQSAAIQITNAASRKRHASHLGHALKHARHASF